MPASLCRSRAVINAVVGPLEREASVNGMQDMVEADDRTADMSEALTTLIDAQRDGIAFRESATRAWDPALYAVPFDAGDASSPVSNYLTFLHNRDQDSRRRQRRLGPARARGAQIRDPPAHEASRDHPRAYARQTHQSNAKTPQS